MKGAVFTVFLDMVAKKYSEDMVDEIIDASDLSTDGAYTTIGSYSHTELMQLLTHLSKQTNIEIPDLLEDTGRHLFKAFVRAQPAFFAQFKSCFDFLKAYQEFIYIDIKKVDKDSDVPILQTTAAEQDSLTLHYVSSLPCEHLTTGLIAESADYFKEKVEVDVKSKAVDSGTDAILLVRKVA